MGWPMIAMAGGMAALNMMREQQRAKAQENYNKGQAEITRYSPWTGMTGNPTMNFNDPLGAGIQGGLSGAMLAQSIGSGFGGKEAAASTAAPEGALGSKGMNGELQAMSDRASMYGKGGSNVDEFQMPVFGARRTASYWGK